MNLTNDLIKRVEDRVSWTVLNIKQKYANHYSGGAQRITLPQIDFHLKSNNVAGLACYSFNQIKINPYYLINHTDEVIFRTVPHEVVHLAVPKLFPFHKQSHGPEFKSIMRNLGLPATRCHTMTHEKRPHIYKCNCKTWDVSNIIHKRMILRKRTCRKCGVVLIYVGSNES